jgi:transposase
MTTAAKPDVVKPNNAIPNRGKRNSMASIQPMDSEPLRHIGIGIDTARYGHRVNFLREDKELAAKAITITENREGYDLLRKEIEALHARHSEAQFHVHIDAAGQYAANLEAFLRGLTIPVSVSIGEPKRNKNYHSAVSPKRATDDTESLAMARFAVVEKPAPTRPIPSAFVILREIASRLQGAVKDSTRAVNRFHNLISRVFPELPMIVTDLDTGWILDLLEKYPSPQRIANASLASLCKISYLRKNVAEAIQNAAKNTVASVSGSAAESLVTEEIVNIRNCEIAEKKLLKLLTDAFQNLPRTGHCQVITIPGIGPATAAVLVAKMVDIERFAAPENVVGYFGIFPEEKSSGVDRKGRHIPPGTMAMCQKGSDIVRRYLWNAARSAIVHNPPVKALYARLRARGVRGDVALGHCMQKLLHLVFAVWSTDRPFDPDYEAKRTAAKRAEAKQVQESQAAVESPDAATSDVVETECGTIDESIAPVAETQTEATAGHNQVLSLENQEVTAAASQLEPVMRSSGTACSSLTHVASESTVDFSFVREQIGFDRVLGHLGLRDTFRGQTQLRGACPLCQSAGTLSVNLKKNVYRCFHSGCSQGNVLDFWSALKGVPLLAAAHDLAHTFGLVTQRIQPTQPNKTSPKEKPKKSGVITPDAT